MVTRRGNHQRHLNPLDGPRYQRFLHALDVVLEGIEAGRFPARPPERDPFIAYRACRYCDPDGLGTREARRNWERTRLVAELAAYQQLVEGAWSP